MIEVLLAAHSAQDPNFAQNGTAHHAVKGHQRSLDASCGPRQESTRARESLDSTRYVEPDSVAFSDLRERLGQWLVAHGDTERVG